MAENLDSLLSVRSKKGLIWTLILTLSIVIYYLFRSNEEEKNKTIEKLEQQNKELKQEIIKLREEEKIQADKIKNEERESFLKLLNEFKFKKTR